LSFSSGDLPGSIYVNNVISGLVEVASFIATFFLLNVMGRRNLTAFPLLFAGVCMIGGMLIVQFCEGKIQKSKLKYFLKFKNFKLKERKLFFLKFSKVLGNMNFFVG
jgi:hypothetical protein